MPQMQKSTKFVIMSHFLEHLKGFKMAEKIIQSAIDIAQDFVFIRQPFFDSDSYLFRKGFLNMWAYWEGHDFHMTSFDFYRILMPLQKQSKIIGFVISGTLPTFDSNDPHIHPLESGSGQNLYNPEIHPPKVKDKIFHEVFKEIEVFIFVKKDKESIEKCIALSDNRKIFFDSNNLLPIIRENLRTYNNMGTYGSEIVGEITVGTRIEQFISIPEDLNGNKELNVLIFMATFCRNNHGKLNIYLIQNGLSEKKCVNTLEIKDNEFFKIKFNKNPFKKGHAILIIKSVDNTEGNAVTAYLTNDTSIGTVSINGKLVNKSLVIKTYLTYF